MRYIGFPNTAGAGITRQTEATAYFAAMTTPPSTAFKDAVNEAIYYWKQEGLWSLILGLWLLCADDSQAARLSVIGDSPRNAVLTGAPTHTALKGFSGFSAANGVTFPITSAILANDAVCGFIACRLVIAATPTDSSLITCDAGDDETIPGSWEIFAGQIRNGAGGGTFMDNTAGKMAGFIQGRGVAAGDVVYPGFAVQGGGSRATRSQNYKTKQVANTSLDRMVAYGFLSHTATNAERASFLAILANLINKLGALD